MIPKNVSTILHSHFNYHTLPVTPFNLITTNISLEQSFMILHHYFFSYNENIERQFFGNY